MSRSDIWLIAFGIIFFLGCVWLAWLFVMAPSASQDDDGFRLGEDTHEIARIEAERRRRQRADNDR
jgi:hypothetical protein